jgi:hypothetical protein
MIQEIFFSIPYSGKYLPFSVLSSSILEQDCEISEYEAVISLIISSSSSGFSVRGDLFGLHKGVDTLGAKGFVLFVGVVIILITDKNIE